MSEHGNFIGMGNNPDPAHLDIPLGFGMALFQEAVARRNFENLSNDRKDDVVRYLQSGNVTGQDAKEKIETAVENLKNNNTGFFHAH